MIDGGTGGAGTGVDEDADVGIKDTTESLEEPAVRIDLLLIAFFETEDHLHWNGILARRGKFHQIFLELDADLRRVLKRG